MPSASSRRWFRCALDFQQGQGCVAKSFDAIILNDHAGHGDEHQHVQRVDDGVGPGGIGIDGRGLSQFIFQRREARLGCPRLRAKIIGGLRNRCNITIRKTHHLGLQPASVTESVVFVASCSDMTTAFGGEERKRSSEQPVRVSPMQVRPTHSKSRRPVQCSLCMLFIEIWV